MYGSSPPLKESKERLLTGQKIREQQSATALGLPPRIREEDGDVAMLESDDVREEEFVDDPVFGQQTPQEVVYPVEMSKLARLRKFP